MRQHVYYLHTNGDLILKPMDNIPDIRDSDLARGLWIMDTEDREICWGMLVEALSSGANQSRVKELAEKWHCDDEDAKVYCARIGVVVGRDGNAWCVHRQEFRNLQEDPAGFGDTILEALADLCRALGYAPSKMWGASFKDLLARTEANA